jgi:hypothetical protein
MEVWPSGAALRGEASNHLMLRWLKTVVVSDEEKAPVRGVRWGSGRRTLSKCRKSLGDIRTGAFKWLRDEPGGCPSIGQVVSGMEAT